VPELALHIGDALPLLIVSLVLVASTRPSDSAIALLVDSIAGASPAAMRTHIFYRAKA
jgi:hypothetical protein